MLGLHYGGQCFLPSKYVPPNSGIIESSLYPRSKICRVTYGPSQTSNAPLPLPVHNRSSLCPRKLRSSFFSYVYLEILISLSSLSIHSSPMLSMDSIPYGYPHNTFIVSLGTRGHELVHSPRVSRGNQENAAGLSKHAVAKFYATANTSSIKYPPRFMSASRAAKYPATIQLSMLSKEKSNSELTDSWIAFIWAGTDLVLQSQATSLKDFTLSMFKNS